MMFRRAYAGLRASGPRWLVRLVPNEYALPRLGITRGIRDALIRASDRLHRATPASVVWSEDCLQVFYDLSVAPVSWDFARTLAAAELERRRRGFAGITVVFVPGAHRGLRKEDPAIEAADDVAARQWRLRHVLLPMLSLLPSVRGFAVCADRDQAWSLIAPGKAHLYPEDYRLSVPRRPDPRDLFDRARENPGVWPLLGATAHGKKLADAWLARVAGERRAIVITLRNTGLSPGRNSRIADWVAFAEGLDPARYAPIFVHDSDAPLPAPPGVDRFPVCAAASSDVEFRMGLFERAWLTMGVLSDPQTLAWTNERARYLVFMPVGDAIDTLPETYAAAGLTVDQDLPMAKPWQRLVWRPDEVSAIRPAFTAMEAQLTALEARDFVESRAMVRLPA
ncbi:hypothetical protein A33M_0668 [Rhodovulum sp. PH10]|uniref:hypothetical protein n=1 Tax=Rhodovulum sp. PH10 TaxID=1187851 RepID=UPI00027C2BDD|nr:hypothetical protein [Rhodovulum sp. PH10]EJW10049.1 hypothetical protein A33M_0668 [Rhodovulum sp. PH10]